MPQEKCMVCEETVNPDEELFVDGFWYHDDCFKCSQCDEYLLENQYSSFDGILYCKPHYEQILQKNRRIPRGISLPKPSELRKTSSRVASIFSKTRDKRPVLKLPPSVKIALPQIISEENDDVFYDLDALITPSNQTILPAGGQSDPHKIMHLLMQNPSLNSLLAGVSNQTETESQDFLKNMLEQLTQNPEMMNSINQLGRQMGGNQDLGSMFAAMNDSNGGEDLDMSFIFQQMIPLFSQAINCPGSSSSLLEHNPPSKHVVHRRCFSDSASLNDLSTECQMNLKEAAQKIEEEYPALEIFSSIVESAALSHDNVYDVCGLADLCSEEELAEEFMEMLKRDVCRRLGKRYDGRNPLS